MLKNYIIFAILLPLALLLFGFLLQVLIPGCHFDEGAGAGGCGPMNAVVEVSVIFGFLGFLLGLLGLVIALPASFIKFVAGGKKNEKSEPKA